MAGSDPVIEVRNLVKDYGNLRAVDGISFEAHPGEIFALLGPNGAGKTTTVEILETLRRATSGTVRVLGLDAASQAAAVRRRIGVLSQDFRAYDTLTVRENLAYFASLYGSRPDLDALLTLVGLIDRAKERYERLSGGLQQRLGIAIALVNDPEVVFLDEPTTGLDPRARRDVWGVVAGLRDRGKTVVLTTHYMEEAQVLADRVAIVNRGRIVDLDRPSRLIAKHAPGQTVTVHGGAGLFQHFEVPAEAANGDLVVRVGDGKELAAVLETLATRAGHGGFEVRSGTLEDVFLSLTGTRVADSGEVVG